MSSRIQVVLLDLGGVLWNLHDPLATFDLTMSPDDFLEIWLLSPSVRKFERGDLTPRQFASEIVQEFALPYSAAEFLRRFELWPDAMYEGVPELLTSIGRERHVALLSNTNEVHWEHGDIAKQITPLLHAVFLSYQTKHMKPELAAFEDVLRHFAVEADRVLFLDDNFLNIDAARECGMQAQLTRGFGGLTQNLQQVGII